MQILKNLSLKSGDEPQDEIPPGVQRALAGLNAGKNFLFVTKEKLDALVPVEIERLLPLPVPFNQMPQQLVASESEYESSVNAIASAIRQCLEFWLILHPGLDTEKAAPIVQKAMKARGLANRKATIREVAQYVLAKIERKELDKFL